MKEEQKEEEVKSSKEEPKKEKTVETKKLLVTSTKTVDFPVFNWGIHAGEVRELPEDQEQQIEILKRTFITLIK